MNVYEYTRISKSDPALNLILKQTKNGKYFINMHKFHNTLYILTNGIYNYHVIPSLNDFK